MLKFTDTRQAYPPKRDAEDRRRDFGEIYQAFGDKAASLQSARCSQCGIPFCQSGCPLQNNIPDWLKLAAEGRLEEAYAVSGATSTMPEICGRICPQDRLCEGACVIEKSGHGTVTIGAVEQYITDTAWAEGWVKPIVRGPDNGLSVGIIGAGPAGLSAAEKLAEAGCGVTIYDRHDRAGGLLVYGIPNFKLDKAVVARRIERLEDAGIEFRLGFEVGRDAQLADLTDRHDSVLIATGVYKARELSCPAGAPAIPALDYLTASNRMGFGETVADFENGRLDASGKRVVVIGGGDTAMDCVRTAVRQGAKSVTCLYRRDRANMPGSAREVKHAEEEGVVFEWLGAPDAIMGDEGGPTSVRAHRMRLGLPGPDGRQAPEPITDSAHDMPADLVIAALGFEAEDLPGLFGHPDLRVTRWGTVKVDGPSLMTSVPGVFAAGDIVRGASLVVWGIRDGMDAAGSMMGWMQAQRARVAAE